VVVLEIAGSPPPNANHFLWLNRTLDKVGGPGSAFPEYWSSTAVLLLFWAIFRIGLRSAPGNPQQEAISGISAVLNSVAVLTVMRYQSFHPEWSFRALIGLGIAEMAALLPRPQTATPRSLRRSGHRRKRPASGCHPLSL